MKRKSVRTLPAAPRPVKVKAPAVERAWCMRCGKFEAQIIGRSESLPVLYLRCDGCHLASISPA